MVARHRISMLGLGLALEVTALAAGCRDFSIQGVAMGGGGQGATEGGTATSGAGGGADASGAPGSVDGGAGREMDGGAPSAGEGGALTGAGGDGGGLGEGPDFSGREVDVTVVGTFQGDATWDLLMPFLSEGAAHFIAYAENGRTTFERLEGAPPTDTTQVWSGEWTPGITALARIAPGGQEWFALYRSAEGERELAAFHMNLQGYVSLINPSAWDAEAGFTHHASTVGSKFDLPALYWYNDGKKDALKDGSLRVDKLSSDGLKLAGSFTSILPAGYHALATLDGRLLGFQAHYFEVYALENPEGEPELSLSNPGPTERVVALELEGVPLLFGYDTTGEARLWELSWAGDGGVKQLWNKRILTGALSVTGLATSTEFLIFLHDKDGVPPQLQVLSVTLKPPA